MKNLAFVIILLSLSMMACGSFSFGFQIIEGSGKITTVTREVSDFTRLDLSSFGKVLIEKGEQETLEIEAEDNLIPYLLTEVDGHTLKLGVKKAVSLHPTKPVIYRLTVKELENIDISGSGEIVSSPLISKDMEVNITGSGKLQMDALSTSKLDLHISGSGDVVIPKIDAQNVDVTITGSGKVELQGKTSEQNIRISGNGDYKAADLESKTASATISGSGNADLWVKEKLEIEITGSGDITYYGEPEVQKHISGSGHVSSRGNK